MKNPVTRTPHHTAVVVASADETDRILRSRTTGRSIEALLSIADPYGERKVCRPPAILRGFIPSVLCVDFFDHDGEHGPNESDVEAILKWGQRNRDLFAPPPPGGVPARFALVHCHMGISRSTAAAYACFAQALGPGQERAAVRLLYASALQVTLHERGIRPNVKLVTLADKLLNRKGAMLRALAHPVLPTQRTAP